MTTFRVFHEFPEDLVASPVQINDEDQNAVLWSALREAYKASQPSRVALRLLALAGDSMNDDWVTAKQSDIGTLAGISRPTVNKVMIEMADDGLIELGRARFRILDPARLVVLALTWNET